MRALPLALYTKGYKLPGDENAETEKGRSTTLEGKKFTCPKKTETFECDAAKRVPVEFNRGTSYKINDLKSPSDEKESEIYCRKNICSVKKNKLYGRVQILEKNATRMTFQMMNLNDSLRFSCDVHTAPEYQVTEFHTKDFTTVECVRSCIGHRVDLSCSSFQQFLQTPHGLGAFLKKADGSKDITFCNEKGNCTCMDGCREYKGRLEPGYKSVNMRTVKMEDAELDFMFYFERDDPRKQKLRECVFKIDPVVCPGKPTRTLEVITGRPLQENESNRTKHPSTISHNVTPGTLEVKRGLLFLCLILAIFTFPG
ncbi:uncharacterized protein [Pocillopora verrucosa]|uniref:uncharacterized protein n=1 Tax=Pocillopora verrucosa TaxID=203993 RepID=UPI00333F6882